MVQWKEHLGSSSRLALSQDMLFFLQDVNRLQFSGTPHAFSEMGCSGLVWLACRFVLQPGSVPEQHRLAAQMSVLRGQCRDLDNSGCSTTADDFADISLVADDHTFRWGRATAMALHEPSSVTSMCSARPLMICEKARQRAPYMMALQLPTSRAFTHPEMNCKC